MIVYFHCTPRNAVIRCSILLTDIDTSMNTRLRLSWRCMGLGSSTMLLTACRSTWMSMALSSMRTNERKALISYKVLFEKGASRRTSRMRKVLTEYGESQKFKIALYCLGHEERRQINCLTHCDVFQESCESKSIGETYVFCWLEVACTIKIDRLN